jgi:hypothetical protein
MASLCGNKHQINVAHGVKYRNKEKRRLRLWINASGKLRREEVLQVFLPPIF